MNFVSTTLREDARILFQDLSRLFPPAELLEWRRDHGPFPHRLFHERLMRLGIVQAWVSDALSREHRLHLKLSLAIAMSRFWPTMHLSLSGASLFLSHFAAKCNEEQRERVGACLEKGGFGAWGLTGPNSGSSPHLNGLSAEMVNGRWLLNGSRCFVTGADSANWLILMARTSERNLTAFLVDRKMRGLYVSPYKKTAMEQSETAEVFLSDVQLDDSDVLGEVGHALDDVKDILTEGRLFFGIGALGLATALLDELTPWMANRLILERGKRMTMGQSSLILGKVALVSDGRALIERLFDIATDEYLNGDPSQGFICATYAKLQSARLAQQFANIAAELFGGASVIREQRISDLLTAAQVYRVGEGSESFLESLIARHEKGKYPRLDEMKDYYREFVGRHAQMLLGDV